MKTTQSVNKLIDKNNCSVEAHLRSICTRSELVWNKNNENGGMSVMWKLSTFIEYIRWSHDFKNYTEDLIAAIQCQFQEI